MRIPEVRERLREIARARGIPELAELADELHRRPYVRKAPARSPKMTAELAEKIARAAELNPNATYMAIASMFRVSVGRVSEVLAGKRE